MNTKEVWQLNDDEFKEIEDLFEKKIALENLIKIVDADSQKLYDKLINDYGKTVHHFDSWWNEMSKKYDWEGKNWWLDFKTKKIMMNQ
ncbi:CXXX repeat peptide modification system protein [Tissierella sp.]|uniref:CXXX repeat peptide modification system protein n=1 Tax=Tissierella sp. TaxID=41274 RepID=UPI00304CFE74